MGMAHILIRTVAGMQRGDYAAVPARGAVQRGFTLIELMITVMILAVMITLAAPSLGGFLQRSRITNASSDFYSDLIYARSEAMRRGKRVTICPSNDSTNPTGCSATPSVNWSTGWIVYVENNTSSSAAHGAFDAGDEIIRVRESLVSGTALKMVATTGTSVISLPASAAQGFMQYRPSGAVDVARGFEICVSGQPGRVVFVPATGRAYVEPTASACS
jgi:type IV fimbrial biogenesis protein FimT